MQKPKCPHCQHEFTDDEIWRSDNFPLGDLETNDFDCPECTRRLYVTSDPIPNWVFSDEDGNDL